MNLLQNRSASDIAVTTRGEVTPAVPDYARVKLFAVLERLDDPVLAVRVKLTQEPHHDVARPSIAQAAIDLNGLPFVFFRDAATGGGSVLYHRYDGHHGFITPAS